jgi:heterodisulfide reductase subunit B
MMRDAKEIEVRHDFQTMPLAEALEVLAQARKMTEVAAFEINQRIEEGQRQTLCTTCHLPLEEGRLWVMQTSEKDPDTGIVRHVQFCKMSCVRERNRSKLMPKGAEPIGADGRELGDIK